jgi:hypothetical protein
VLAAHEQLPRVEVLGIECRWPGVVLRRVADQAARHHVQVASECRVEAAFEVVRLPCVVVVEDRDEHEVRLSVVAV